MRRFGLFFLLLMLVSSFAWAQKKTVAPFVMPSARFSALGGMHTTMADDFYSIFLNPAGFASVKEQFSAAEITLSTYGPMFEIIDLFRNNSGSIEDLDISSLMGPGGLAAGFDMGGPLSLGWVGRGLGLGIFNRIVTTAAASGTYIRPVVAAELLFVGGYGFRVLNIKGHSHLDAGFLAKGFFRGLLNMKTSIFSLDSIDPTGSPFDTNLGFGLDAGVKFNFRDMLSFAMVCYDVYSPVLVTTYIEFSDFGSGSSASPDYATVQRRLDFGASYHLRTEFLERYISRLSFMLSYNNFLDLFALIPRNAILNIGFGVELVLLNALTFRVGLTDALPAFGIGLDLTFMKMDIAIFGRELGFDPGMQSVYAMSIGLLFRY